MNPTQIDQRFWLIPAGKLNQLTFWPYYYNQMLDWQLSPLGPQTNRLSDGLFRPYYNVCPKTLTDLVVKFTFIIAFFIIPV